MKATSQAGSQCGVGLGANLSVRTPNIPAGQPAESGSAVVTPAKLEREYSTEATQERSLRSSWTPWLG